MKRILLETIEVGMWKTGIITMMMVGLMTGTLWAQNQANVWYFGSKTGLNFSGMGAPTTLNNGPDMKGSTGEGEGCTTISDQNGNLLFFSDGDNCWDRTRTTMPNGTGLAGSFTSTQSALIIARPGSVLTSGGYPRYYYLFTIDAVTGGGQGLRYSIIDMELQGNGTPTVPLGDVVAASKNVAVQNNVVEGMIAIPHFNGTDMWILVRGLGTTNNYYSIPVSSAGVGTPVSSSAGIAPMGTSTYIIKSNPCYNMIAITYHSNWVPPAATGYSDNCFEILRYDNQTGLVSSFPTNLRVTNVRQLSASNDYRGIYGIEWSPSGRYLFVSELVDKDLYQYDVFAGGTYPGTVGTLAAISASKQNLGVGSGTRTGHVQLGPNGRIYTAQHVWGSGTSYVGEIANPDAATATWNSTAYSWSMSNSDFVCMGLPTLPKSFTAGKVTIGNLTSACTNTSQALSYTYLGAAAPSSQTWSAAGGTFNPGTTVAAPSVTFSTPGTKTINLTVTDAICSYTRTDSKTITVYDEVTAAGTISCSPVTGTVTSPNASYKYGWFSDAAATTPIAIGTSVSLPVPGSSGNVYLRAISTSSSSGSAVALTNGPASAPNDNNATGTTMDFTANQVVNFTSFQWRTRDATYSASPAYLNATITITNTATSNVVYTRTQNNVLISDAANSAGTTYTETVNKVLPPGTYRITISGIGARLRGTAGWNGCMANDPDPQSALTYNSAGGGECLATNFNYTITPLTIVTIPCSPITAVPYNCPLPVTWLSFSGEKHDEGNLLSWSTASEHNASHFEIERSINGIDFEFVGSMDAKGNTNEISNYSFIDQSTHAVVYYRLKQVDIDGAFDYSNTVLIKDLKSVYSLQPNPGNGIVYLTGASENTKVNVLDLQGRIVLSDLTASAAINLSELAKGIYLFQVVEMGSVATLRYIKE